MYILSPPCIDTNGSINADDLMPPLGGNVEYISFIKLCDEYCGGIFEQGILF